MEARYTAAITILGNFRRAMPGDPPFTAKSIGIKDANIPHLVKRGFLVPYVDVGVVSNPEIVDDGQGESGGTASLNAGSPWVFDPTEFAESTHVELLSLIDTVCEEYGLTPPSFKQRKPETIKEAALKHLSQDRA